MAAVAAVLLGPEAGFVTGQVVGVDGGRGALAALSSKAARDPRLSRARDDRRLAQAPWARKMGPMTETTRARADPEAGLEADLRAVAERHDREAFGRIFAFYAPRVKAYLRRLGAEDAVAEDLTQEAMLSVWRRAQQFDPRRAALTTRIFTIARNKRIDALRRDRRPDYDPEDPAIVEPVDDVPRGDQVAETLSIRPPPRSNYNESQELTSPRTDTKTFCGLSVDWRHVPSSATCRSSASSSTRYAPPVTMTWARSVRRA